MKTISRKIYVTDDGREYVSRKDAKNHELLMVTQERLCQYLVKKGDFFTNRLFQRERMSEKGGSAMYIFLDIDGVLNCKKQWSKNYALDDSCIEHFYEFASATGGKIILATSWRKAWAGRNNPSNPPHIKQLEEKLGRHGCKIYGKTISVDGRRRDEEIKAFLEAHPGEPYIIIDDDRTEYSEHSRRPHA